ncbi:hypothetical protein BpHYR1_011721 [Brachionus plicatilis]|uniref:Uncharacterized protein n=1 Tax=Brachionus plicatilis TaxID=10195 RepID=A0A3M7SK69_BRAPC|nr:hypothetical protein BpHYR1_011721 [Brachionus plicatilis]
MQCFTFCINHLESVFEDALARHFLPRSPLISHSQKLMLAAKPTSAKTIPIYLLFKTAFTISDHVTMSRDKN